MINYNCFICNSYINGAIFKAYDKNLCKPYCRDYLITNFTFNSNYELEKIQKPHNKQGLLRNKKEKKQNPPEKNNNYINTKYTTSPNYEHSNFTETYIYEKNKLESDYQIATNYLKELSNGIIYKENCKNEELSDERTCMNLYNYNFDNLPFKNIINNILDKTISMLIY